LALARREGYTLVYWAAESNHPVPSSLLSDYCGSLVDRKTVFSAELPLLFANSDTGPPTGVEVAEYPPGEPSSDLVALGIAAGTFSRFFRDPRIPKDAARRLYAIWTAKSARRELADVVFVARQSATPERLVGMVSCARRSEAAAIGLIAVDSALRGIGIGRALLDAAHRWMIASGAVQAEVVTQQCSIAACRLYKSCGYTIGLQRDYYHFWLNASSH